MKRALLVLAHEAHFQLGEVQVIDRLNPIKVRFLVTRQQRRALYLKVTENLRQINRHNCKSYYL